MKKLIIPIFLCILLSSISLAFMDDTHTKLIQDACKSYPNHVCCKNMDACINGDLFTDWTVIDYFSARIRYGITHSENFCESVLERATTDKEKAIAFGCLLHQVQDTVAHNQAVPWTILHTLFPNVVIHVFLEEKINDWVLDKSPTIRSVKANSLDWRSYWDATKVIYEAQPTYSRIDVPSKLQMLQAQMVSAEGRTTGYDVAWKSKFSLPLGYYVVLILILLLFLVLAIKLMILRNKNWLGLSFMFLTILIVLLLAIFTIGFSVASYGFALFQKISTPFTSMVPSQPISAIYYKALDNTKEVLRDSTRYKEIIAQQGVASGFNVLDRADSKIIPVWVVVSSIIILLSGFFAYRHFKGIKNFWEYFQK